VLVDLRAQVVDAHRGGRPSAEGLAFKAASVALADSRRLGFGERFTGAGLRVARRFGGLPGLRQWTSARDLPPAPPESFRAWWRRTGGGRHG
jgi:L-lactate dehydrogenase complex protein LldF